MEHLWAHLRRIVLRLACAAPLLLLAEPCLARRRSDGWHSVHFSWEGVTLTILLVGAIIGAGFIHRRRRTTGATHASSDRFKDNLVRWRWRAWRHHRAGWIASLVTVMAVAFAVTSGMLDRPGVNQAITLFQGGDRGTVVTRPGSSSQPKVIHVGRPAGAAASGRAVIIDGDTFSLGGEKIRILNIDTPESVRSRCEEELVLALRAKARLRELLDAGPIDVERDGKDRYGRTLARVSAGGRDVGAVLIAEGHALPYREGAAAKLARLRAWCGPGANLDGQ